MMRRHPSRPQTARHKWGVHKIRGPNVDPKYWGSYCKDTQEVDPQFIYGNSHISQGPLLGDSAVGAATAGDAGKSPAKPLATSGRIQINYQVARNLSLSHCWGLRESTTSSYNSSKSSSLHKAMARVVNGNRPLRRRGLLPHVHLGFIHPTVSPVSNLCVGLHEELHGLRSLVMTFWSLEVPTLSISEVVDFARR